MKVKYPRYLKIIVTQEDFDALKRIAAEKGLTRSELLRNMIAGELAVDKMLKGFNGHPPIPEGYKLTETAKGGNEK